MSVAFMCESGALSVTWPLGFLVVGGLGILPFVLPTTRRWGRTCGEARLAFALAYRRDIETAISLPAQKYPLRVSWIVAFVLFVAGLGVFPPFLLSPDEAASSFDNRCRRPSRLSEASDVFHDGETMSVKTCIKRLCMEGVVIPPRVEEAKTLGNAVSNVLAQVGKRSAVVSSNGIETLNMPYRQLGDGRSYEVEWRKALCHLLTPVGFDFFEDGELVFLGCAKEVALQHRRLAQERLAANRTKIVFGASASEDNLILRNAIRDVASKANVIITTEYMEPKDLFVPSRERKLSLAEIIGEKHGVRRTAYSTGGRNVEWRVVLREILEPFGYDFVEVDGVVRIAKWRKLAQWRREGR